ncbi:MAG: hypothetical protein A4S14_21165 [Proteobacteria bacterium SG_bin9]|nr:MAG: hypothetical protein A4S14_21165 [Proteobacteria bacterium SG_bin9]
MALLGRIIVIFVAFCAACFAAGAIIVMAVIFPEWSDVRLGLDDGTFAIITTIGFVFVSGFALLPALVAAVITEGFSIRSVLFYAVCGAVVGAVCYLGMANFDAATMSFNGLIRRELEVMSGAGVIAGLVYWMIAGRNAGRWRETPPSQPR